MSTELTPEEAGAIARQAFIYGFPMVENYGLMYAQAVTGTDGFNHMASSARLYGPEDTDVVTPNNDTPYSMAWLDLGGGPVELSAGPISPRDRYWSFQVIDFFTNNIAYVGSRATGPADSSQTFLFTGPGWQGTPASEVKETIPCPSRLIFLIGRTQLFGADDIPNVEAIQDGYRLTAPAVPASAFIPYDKDLIMTLEFFSYMNQCFVFQLPPASDADLMTEFAKINVGPGLTFDPNAFSAEVRDAMLQAMLDAKKEIVEAAEGIGLLVEGWSMPQVDQEYFGTTLEDYLFRAAIGYKGIYANSPIEALYPIANLDVNGKLLTGAGQQAYTIRFEGGALPPVQFFWSLTMYYAESKLLVANSIDRYSISNRTEGVVVGADGSLEFYVQYAQPEGEAVKNWLPAPDEAFYVVLRLYGPEGAALEGEYGEYKVPPFRPSEPPVRARPAVF